MVVFFFFFKQKTAYEMRISDWSSDVCSSDLLICACLVGLAILVGQMVVDTSILLTSLISSAVVIITAPASKASYPARVLTSHLVAALTGLVLRSFLPISPWSVAAAVGFALLIVLVAEGRKRHRLNFSH